MQNLADHVFLLAYVSLPFNRVRVDGWLRMAPTLLLLCQSLFLCPSAVTLAASTSVTTEKSGKVEREDRAPKSKKTAEGTSASRPGSPGVCPIASAAVTYAATFYAATCSSPSSNFSSVSSMPSDHPLLVNFILNESMPRVEPTPKSGAAYLTSITAATVCAWGSLGLQTYLRALRGLEGLSVAIFVISMCPPRPK